jgi:hypothetical protein
VLRGSAKDIALGTKIQIISAPSAPSTANTR